MRGRSVKTKSAIFDLDGTLIDSAPSILKCLKLTIQKFGIVPSENISQGLIGPPLSETLKKILGNNSNVNTEDLSAYFKALYDFDGYKESIPYSGIDDLLRNLVCEGVDLYIATNKRIFPAEKIIDLFGWRNFFKGVYGIDKFEGSLFEDKASMIHCLLNDYSLDIGRSVYIGDRYEDFNASSANGLSSILVNWGYSDIKLKNLKEVQVASNPKMLFSMILART